MSLLLRRRRVALLGASLDPPTGDGGHGGIVSHFAASPDFDEVWIIPVFIHPFVKTKKLLASFEDRMHMARIGLCPRGENIRVIDAERTLANLRLADGKDPVFGTMDLIEWLLAVPPQTFGVPGPPDFEFSLILGRDTLCDLLEGKWRRSNELIRTVKLVGLERKGVLRTLPPIPSEAKHVSFIHIPGLTAVTSTGARAATTLEALRTYCDETVCSYIVERGLYCMGEIAAAAAAKKSEL